MGRRTKLVVSVRDAVEAAVAVAAGADLIDAKEPTRGSLGRCDPGVVTHIVDAVAGRVPVSAALGEIGDWPAPADGVPQWWSNVQGVTWAKVGLSATAARPDWPNAWRQIVDASPRTVTPVAVVYADWRTAVAAEPGRVLDEAARIGCPLVLVDTCDKTHGDLFVRWPLDSLHDFVETARARKFRIALAGSLSIDSLPDVLALKPDYVAVRGAVCVSDRTATISRKRVALFANQLTLFTKVV